MGPNVPKYNKVLQHEQQQHKVHTKKEEKRQIQKEKGRKQERDVDSRS